MKLLQNLVLFSLLTIIGPACLAPADRGIERLPSVEESEAAFTTVDVPGLDIEGRLTQTAGQFEDSHYELTAIEKTGERLELHTRDGDSGRAMFILDMKGEFLDELVGPRGVYVQEINQDNYLFEAGIIGCQTDAGYNWDFDQAATHGTVVYEPVGETTTLITVRGEWRTDAGIVQHLVEAEVFVDVTEDQ